VVYANYMAYLPSVVDPDLDTLRSSIRKMSTHRLYFNSTSPDVVVHDK